MKRIFRRLFIILCLAILGFFIYTLVDSYWGKYFMPEWSFSKSIKTGQIIENCPKIDSSFFVYKIYYNREIDFTIKFLNNGIVLYQDSSWYTDRISKSPIYFTKIDDSEMNELLNLIGEIKDDSDGSSIDDHLSGYYYTMTIHKTNNGKLFDKEIGYYNTNPDRKFKSLKNHILDLLKNKTWKNGSS